VYNRTYLSLRALGRIAIPLHARTETTPYSTGLISPHTAKQEDKQRGGSDAAQNTSPDSRDAIDRVRVHEQGETK
jgi:hypothetical protein